MKDLTHLDLFSGIGGFSLAAGWAGFRTIGFVEIDPFCRKVLKKHWPEVPIHEDVKTFRWPAHAKPVSILSGGFPCQPVSSAGRRRGKSDDRYLWPEMLRIIRDVRPAWVVGENVAGILSLAQFDRLLEVDEKAYTKETASMAKADMGEVIERIGRGILEEILESLESLEYVTRTFVIPACAVDAPHRRDRVWIVGHAGEREVRRERERSSLGVTNEGRTTSPTRFKSLCAGEKMAFSIDARSSGKTLANGQGGESWKSETRNGRSGFIGGRQEATRSMADSKKRSKRSRFQSGTQKRIRERRSCNNGCENDADTSRKGLSNGNAKSARTYEELARTDSGATRCSWPTEPDVGRVAHGVPSRVDRLKALGNAIVPQVAFEIFRAIAEIERAQAYE